MCELLMEMGAMKARLTAAENHVEELRNMETTLTAMETRLSTSESLMEKMKTDYEETIRKFSNVLTNVGNGYNPVLGVFDAPVRGFYYFSFSSFAHNVHPSCTSLFKDCRRVLSACDHYTDTDYDHTDSSGNYTLRRETMST
ncbi:unnamed protein product [Coregonus sp. 'balchen']|nr:unnamed protein product [Coregonus sp. 'balchen']